MVFGQGFHVQAETKMARKQRDEPESSDEGGPARMLVLAPPELRCAAKVVDGCGGETQCTRYTVKRRDGTRTLHCVAHTDDDDVLRRRTAARDKLRKQREDAA